MVVFVYLFESSATLRGGVEQKRRHSVAQDFLDEVGHVRLFGVVEGEKGVLLDRKRTAAVTDVYKTRGNENKACLKMCDATVTSSGQLDELQF